MQRAYAKVSGEMPDVNPVSVSPSSSSLLTKWFMPHGANAVTNPFTGNVIYNPDMMQGVDDNERQQIIAHELTHNRQREIEKFNKLLGIKLFGMPINQMRRFQRGLTKTLFLITLTIGVLMKWKHIKLNGTEPHA